MLPFLRAAAVWLLAALPFSACGQEKTVEIQARAFRVRRPMTFSEQPMRKVTDAKAELEAAGVTFPAGANATLYYAAEILMVRNTEANIKLVADYIASHHNPFGPAILTFTTHLIQAPGSVLRPLTAPGPADQTQALEALLAQASDKNSGVQVLHTLYAESLSGQRCQIESAADYLHIGSLDLGAKGRVSVHTGKETLGFRMEIDPVLGGDRKTMDLNIAPTFTLLAQKPRQETLADPNSAGLLEMPVPEFHKMETGTSVTLMSGQSRLLALWPAKTADVCQAVFLTAHVVRPKAQPAAFMLPAPPKDYLKQVQRTFDLPAELLANAGKTPEALKELLQLNGIPLPEKSIVTLDVNSRVTVTTTAEMMPVVEAWVEQFDREPAPMADATVEIIRGPAPLLREVIRACAGASDHEPGLEPLRKALADGKAQLLTVIHQETRSGRADPKLFSGIERHRIDTLSWRQQSEPAFTTERESSGTSWEWQPRTEGSGSAGSGAPDGVTLDYSLRHDHTPPAPWHETLVNPSLGERFLLPRDEFRHAAVQSQGRFLHDQPNLIAAWRPAGEDGQLGDDVLDTAILTCRLVRLQPQDDTPLSGATPPKQAPAPPSKELFSRMYRVPPDYLTSSSASSDSDPFAAATPAPSPPIAERPTVKEILEAQGVTFPEGSSAYFNPVTSQLQVRNTEANHQIVAAYVALLNRQGPKMINLTLHLLEAPAPIVQKMLGDHAAETDHAQALKQLLTQPVQADVRSVATLSLVTKSGQRATASQIRQQRFIKAITFAEDGALEINRDNVWVGSTFEADPVIGGDGLTMDIDMQFAHHPAPAVLRTENLAAAGQPAIEIPLTDFHVERYEGSVRMPSGTRILSVWKPTGKPEFTEKNLLHIAILEAHVLKVWE